MNLRVNDMYLEFEGDVDVEKKIKLFEVPDGTEGDFSYQFEVDKTHRNKAVFKLYSIDQGDKIIYRNVPCEIIDTDGVATYSGFIRVESEDSKVYRCSFFSGNSNWFAMVEGNVRDLDLAYLDHTKNTQAIIDRFTSTDGIIYPLINNGSLGNRRSMAFVSDDFKPFIYVHTVVERIFRKSNLKYSGNLFNDPAYRALTTAHAEDIIGPDEITNNRAILIKTVSNFLPDSGQQIITFDNTTQGGINWNAGLNRFGPVTQRMVVSVKFTFTYFLDNAVGPNTENDFYVQIRKNGVSITDIRKAATRTILTGADTVQTSVTLEVGDYIDINVQYFENSGFGRLYIVPPPGLSTDPALNVTTVLSITPTNLFKTYAYGLLPDWTCKKFINEILKLFNPLVTYNSFSKTVNIDFFKDLNDRPEIDISQFAEVETVEADYSDFISSYGKRNLLVYGGDNELLDDDVTKIDDVTGMEYVFKSGYNKVNTVPYGTGVINAPNDYIEDEVEIVSVDFAASPEDDINPLNTSLVKTIFVNPEEGDEYDITNVSVVTKRISINNSSRLIGVNSVIRIDQSTEANYVGDWVVTEATATYIKLDGFPGNVNATGKLKLLELQTNEGPQVLLFAIPGIRINQMSNQLSYKLDNILRTGGLNGVATAYFDKPLQGLYIDKFRQSLSFGTPSEGNRYQVTLTKTYWDDLRLILADPVKVTVDVYLPKAIFQTIDFTRPLRYKDGRFNSKFYGNSITGYKSKIQPATIALIKI